MDPAGVMFMVSDKNTNSLIVQSASDDNEIKIIATMASPEGCGPSRGAFYAMAGAAGHFSTRCFALCQPTKDVLVLGLDLSAGEFKMMQRLQTSVGSKADKRSVAEPLHHINNDNSADIYMSNSSKGKDTNIVLPAPRRQQHRARRPRRYHGRPRRVFLGCQPERHEPRLTGPIPVRREPAGGSGCRGLPPA
ncbi:hypothetical protein diail_7415 [Diaporthe ilicicola]|nr:hypothetical protein diail_7415 [Diaporthe ilicicola]